MGVAALLAYCVYAEEPGVSTAPDVANGSFEEPLSFDFFALSADQKAAYLLDVARQFEAAGAYPARYRMADVMVVPSQEQYVDPSQQQNIDPSLPETAGYVECWDYRAGNPHKGDWNIRGIPTMQLVKAKGRRWGGRSC